MAQPIKVSMPPDLDLGPGYVLRINCVDATTGAAVTGCVTTDFQITCEDLTGGGGAGLETGPFMLVPGPGA